MTDGFIVSAVFVFHISSPNPNGKAVGASIAATSCAFIVHEEMKVCCTAKRSAVALFVARSLRMCFEPQVLTRDTSSKNPNLMGRKYLGLHTACQQLPSSLLCLGMAQNQKFAPTILSHIDPGVLERLLFAKKGCDMRSRIKSCEIQ